MSDSNLCRHWRSTGANGGRVLKAEYAQPGICTYCEIDRLKRLLPVTEITEIPIRLMFEKINELAEDMYISGVINLDEDCRLQAIFDEIAARHGIVYDAEARCAQS